MISLFLNGCVDFRKDRFTIFEICFDIGIARAAGHTV